MKLKNWKRYLALMLTLSLMISGLVLVENVQTRNANAEGQQQTEDAEATPTPEATENAEATPTPEATENAEATPTPEATENAEATPTPEATENAEATPTPTATENAEATPTPEATENAEATPTPTATATPEPVCDHANAAPTGNVTNLGDDVTFVDENNHRYARANVEYYCPDCQNTWTEEKENYTKAHDFENCKCKDCQYEHHANAGVTNYEYLNADGFVNTDNIRHTYTGDTNVSYHCSDCGKDWTAAENGVYQAVHKYTLNLERSKNSSYHILECVCGAEKVQGHTAYACNSENPGICSTCGGNINVPMKHGNEVDSIKPKDEYTHYKKACADCGEPLGYADRHYANCENSGVCAVCGYEDETLRAEHDWIQDGDNRICSKCGADVNEHITVQDDPIIYDRGSDSYDIYYESDELRYESYNKEMHWEIGVHTRYIDCRFCWEGHEEVLGEMRHLTEHFFDENGVCEECNYVSNRNDCAHSNTVVVDEDYTIVSPTMQ